MIVAGRLIRLLSRSILNVRQRRTVNFSSRYVIDDHAVADAKSDANDAVNQVTD